MDEDTPEQQPDHTDSSDPSDHQDAPDQAESSGVEQTSEAEAVKPDTDPTDEQDVVESAVERAPIDVIPERSGRARRVLTILAAVLGIGILLALAGVAYATYDFKNEYDGKLLPGTTVGGVDVSGLNQKKAVAKVAAAMRPELNREVTVSFGSKSWKVTPKELGARTNARAAVLTAMEASESASWVDLASMRFMDEELDVEEGVGIHYPKEGAREYMAQLGEDVNAEPRDAELDYSTGWVKIKKERYGYKLRERRSSQALMAALVDGKSSAELDVRETKPAVTSDSFDQVLLVRQGDYTVYMYNDGKITHQWPVAIGTGGYPTPTGEYEVELLRYMPTWINPDPEGWGADMPDMIPPGPGNPLGLRAINWTAPGIRFHGTSATSSIGTAASHGCVRMYNEDVIELYDLVKVGTPIISIWG